MLRIPVGLAIVCFSVMVVAAYAADSFTAPGVGTDLGTSLQARPFMGQYVLGKDWTASIDAIFLSRSNPGSLPLVMDSFGGANELINANDFSFGSESGYQVNLLWRGLHSARMAFELKYFAVGDWTSDVPQFNSSAGGVI